MHAQFWSTDLREGRLGAAWETVTKHIFEKWAVNVGDSINPLKTQFLLNSI
jgi:hypothetical protein